MIRDCTVLAGLLLVSLAATADVFRPAYLEIRELGGDEYAVVWKVPALGSERRLAAYVRLPEGADFLDEPRIVATDNNWVENFTIRSPGGLAGQAITIEGNAAAALGAVFQL